MSETRKEFVFSARDTGVANEAEKIRRSVQGLGQDMMRDSVSQTSTAKDAIKHYEDQIRLLEKRNRLDQQQARVASQGQLRTDLAGATTDGQRRAAQQAHTGRMSEATQENAQDKLQTELLRELLETTKKNSKDEKHQSEKIHFSEMSQEQRLAAVGNNSLGGVSSALATEEAEEEARRQGRGQAKPAGIAAMEDVAGQESAGGAGGAMLGNLAKFGRAGVAGLAALAIYKTAGAIFGAGEKREMRYRNVAGLTGEGVSDLSRSNMGMADAGEYGAHSLNVDMDELLGQSVPGMVRARGSSENYLKRTMEGLEVQKGMSINPSVVSGMESAARFTSGVGGSADVAQAVYRAMAETGALGAGGQDMSRMEGILQSYVGYQQEFMNRTGEMSTMNASLGAMQQFESMGGVYKDDNYKMGTIQSMSRGLSSASNPAVKAIKMQMLRQMNPEMGFFDLEAEMETGIESEGFLKNVMQFIEGTGMNDDAKKILFSQMTGGQMKKADVSRIIEGGVFDDGLKLAQSGQEFDFKAKALSASSELGATKLGSDEAFNAGKAEIIEAIQKVVEAFKEFTE